MIRRLLLTVLGGGLVLGLVAAGAVYLDYQQWLAGPVHEEADGLEVDIPRGSSFREVRDTFDEAGLLADRPWYFEFLARERELAGRLRAGEYRIPAGVTPAELLEQIVRGRVIQYSLTIIEGWTFNQLRAAINANPHVLNTLDDLSDEEVMARLGAEDQHPEGWFFPDTYHFPRGTTDEQLLRRALRTMQDTLEELWAERDESVPLESPYEGLILASIIERETGQAAERDEVAGVFVRRLRRGMRLQTDPTVIYGMGSAYEGRIRRSDLETDTPYNTYTRHGLPPTPIAMPGRASLEAAMNPAEGSSLFFVSRGDGTHYFSDTYDEHRRAVRRYILGRD
ncbi:endolytic transglycosylase MltG [Methylonatrum kenyense]|uniref:endolytic transglycosylase MltG n=1 Tax=Methylonatrum kenyense TaxID=455253 RepID=UPI0020BF5B44|nr:endolytic transglycosylase MltG [Methylonatrum kenyense]MCK8516499.1 endolytic transglycosylase MltG [Methylonatrum kenyense]